MNKYYTPDVEDLFIGYECELLSVDKPWIKGIYPEILTLCPTLRKFKSDHLKLENTFIRTKYLDKEDIESLGWVHHKSITHVLTFDKDNYQLWILENNQIKINQGGRPLWIHTRFKGECKSINELRKIMKLLKVK